MVQVPTSIQEIASGCLAKRAILNKHTKIFAICHHCFYLTQENLFRLSRRKIPKSNDDFRQKVSSLI